MFSLVHANHQPSPDVHGGVSRETQRLERARRLSGQLLFALLRSGLGKTLLWPGQSNQPWPWGAPCLPASRNL